MTLIAQIKVLCDRLAAQGWRDYLKATTGGALDIQQKSTADLAKMLAKTVQVVRSFSGLEDFAIDGTQAVTPGEPSRSLLYHALASPLVVRDHQGKPFGAYATPAELDLVENYIFSLSTVSLTKFLKDHGGAGQVAIAVFALEYRPLADTVDGRHADLTFSRTGIARVGTQPSRYLPSRRGFWPEDDSNPQGICVVPARFSVWLAVRQKGRDARVSPILDNQEGQSADEPGRDFWVPVHKLFSGNECLVGQTLDIQFQLTLFNLKIQRIHKVLKTVPLPDTYPYVLRDAEIASLAVEADLGPGWVLPKVRPALVAQAMANGSPVTFKVAKKAVDDFAAVEVGNGAPAYVHGRTRVVDGAFQDLNEQLDVVAEMKKKPYEALHYVDFTGEGWVTTSIAALGAAGLPVHPAYALVSAPDFFPSTGQFALSEWSRSPEIPAQFRSALWSWSNVSDPNAALKPTPLSETRMPANLQLPGTPFTAADDTITALVGRGAPTGLPDVWPQGDRVMRSTHLPDDAAGIFAPGWDVSTDTLKKTTHLAGYALGSPFPEDAKLCAALSTFWPAVAPDVFRTFVNPNGNTNGTVAPLTDEEIGQVGSTPWDGVPGPREVLVGGTRLLEFAAFLQADYVQQALENRFTMRLLARIGAQDYEQRMLAACRMYSVLAHLGDVRLERNRWHMMSFREISNGDADLQQAQAEGSLVLTGQVYAGKLCLTDGVAVQRIDAHTMRMPIVNETQFYASALDRLVLVKRPQDATFGQAPSEA